MGNRAPNVRMLGAFFLVLFIAGNSGKAAETAEASPWQQKQWLKLLHYRQTSWGDFRSDIDNKNFFFAGEAGRRDPKAEFQATIQAFLRPADDASVNQQHPQCAYPARLGYIKSVQPDLKLPKVDCSRFLTWQSRLRADTVWLVFASSYLNNPASMFGHTFFRLDSIQTGNNPLLQYGVGFGANVYDENSFLYPLKGLLGFYSGVFTMQPYFEKTSEYSNMESRDLWEYPVNLSQEQRQRLLSHLWEMGNAQFDYYFLDENCSFHLLSILEVANPEWNLLDDYYGFVIPSETIRLIRTKHPEILGEPVYRPSLESIRNSRFDNLSDQEKAQVRGFEKTGEVPPEASAAAIDGMLDAYRHRAYRKNKTQQFNTPEYRSLLVKRAKAGSAPNTIGESKPVTPPDQGHPPTRLSTSYTYWNRTKISQYKLSYRAAYHDLLDPPRAYLPFSHVTVGTLEGSIDHVTQGPTSFHLDNLTFLEIDSYNPIRSWDSWLSWQVQFGVQRWSLDPHGHLHPYLAGGPGITTPGSVTVGYVFLLGRAHPLDLMFYPGTKVGVVSVLSEHLGLHLSGQVFWDWRPETKRQAIFSIDGETRWHWHKEWSSGTKIGYVRGEGAYGQVFSQHYF